MSASSVRLAGMGELASTVKEALHANARVLWKAESVLKEVRLSLKGQLEVYIRPHDDYEKYFENA